MIIKKMCMKKILIIGLAVSMVISVVGCTSNEGTKENDETETVLSTENANEEADEFEENWFKTYTYFESDAGKTIEMIFWDTINYFDAVVNGFTAFSFDGSAYSQDIDGAYVYDAEVGGAQLKYYPNDGSSIVFIFNGESTKYYPAEKIEPKPVKYMAETVRCSNFSVRVLYAYTVRTNERLNVNIYCEVTNTSGRNWVFETPQYFKLNNNGILQSGHCDYDNAELANGASFYTTISFAYPENANANIGDMELTIEYDTVYLLNNPKTSDEFEGIYYADDGENYYVIAHISDNRYQMIYELFNEIEVEEFVLNEDNTFYPYSYDGAEAYIWLPQMHSIYHKDESLRIEFYLYKL